MIRTLLTRLAYLKRGEAGRVSFVELLGYSFAFLVVLGIVLASVDAQVGNLIQTIFTRAQTPTGG